MSTGSLRSFLKSRCSGSSFVVGASGRRSYSGGEECLYGLHGLLSTVTSSSESRRVAGSCGWARELAFVQKRPARVSSRRETRQDQLQFQAGQEVLHWMSFLRVMCCGHLSPSEWRDRMPGQPRSRLCVGTIVGVVRPRGYWRRRWPASRTAATRRDDRCEQAWWRGCLELVGGRGDDTTYGGLLALGSVAAVSGCKLDIAFQTRREGVDIFKASLP